MANRFRDRILLDFRFLGASLPGKWQTGLECASFLISGSGCPMWCLELIGFGSRSFLSLVFWLEFPGKMAKPGWSNLPEFLWIYTVLSPGRHKMANLYFPGQGVAFLTHFLGDIDNNAHRERS
jgi:hypothetical protein